MKKHADNDSFWFNSGILALAAILGRVIGLIYRIPLTQILGDLGNNNYGCAFDIYYIVWLLSSYCLPMAISRLVAEGNAASNPTYLNEIIRTGILYGAMLGCFASVFLGIFAKSITEDLLKTPDSLFALYALVPALTFAALSGVLRGYFQGLKKMTKSAISQILEQLVNAFVSVFAADFLSRCVSTKQAKAAWGAAGASFGTTVGASASFLFLSVLFCYEQRKWNESKPLFSIRQIPWKKYFTQIQATILPMLGASFFFSVNIAVEQGMFKQLLSGRLSADLIGTQWGIYSGKMKTILNLPIAAATAIGAASIPEITAAVSKNELLLAAEKSKKAFRYTLYLAVPSVFFTAIFSKAIPEFLFHDTQVLTWHLIGLGAIAILFYSCASVSASILQAAGKIVTTMLHSIVALCFEILCLYLLLKNTQLEIYAVFIAMTAYGLLVSILNDISCFRLFLKKRCVILEKKSKESWRNV